MKRNQALYMDFKQVVSIVNEKHIEFSCGIMQNSKIPDQRMKKLLVHIVKKLKLINQHTNNKTFDSL